MSLRTTSGIPLLVVVGPTAVGKTALAVRLAERLRGEIVSADSRQIYRGFDIGTGKPTPEEAARVKHHLISTSDPHESVTAAEYARQAGQVLDDLTAQGIPGLVVGGTGLWIRALVDGMAPTPPSDPDVRRELQALGVELGDEALHRELASVDPETARRLPPGDRLRVIRALEIFRLTGQPASTITALPPGDAQRPAYWLGLYRSRDEMYARAQARIDLWLESGWLAEVERLLASGLEPECPAFQALGYAHLVRYLREKGSWEQTVEWIKRDTRRYIKRQGTWFRANPRIAWVDVSDETAAWCEVQMWLSKIQAEQPPA